MNYTEIVFWSLLFLVFYTYLGYGLVLMVMVKIKNAFSEPDKITTDLFEPNVTMMVAAYNEQDVIEQKVNNMLALDYPQNKLQLLFVSDGSYDGTPDILRSFKEVTVLHEEKRLGKTAAINRGMKAVKHSIIIFSDANAMLNKDAVKEIVKHYINPVVGCVAGEKRVDKNGDGGVSGAGEGLYWKYESLLKKLDSNLNTAVGAAGELFSIRKKLYQHVETDTILDDFMISMRIAKRGYKIAYEPKAYATESASVSIKEEMKRKIRISAGGMQSIIRLLPLFNFFTFGLLSFQYISHRVLRWTVSPIALICLVPLSFLLMIQENTAIYSILFYAQMLLYVLAFFGWYRNEKQNRIKIFFIPFYFFFMNLCVFLGFFRFINGNQSVLWDKAKRI